MMRANWLDAQKNSGILSMVQGNLIVFFPFRRKIVVAKQNYRCAGCGTRIDPGTTTTASHMHPFLNAGV